MHQNDKHNFKIYLEKKKFTLKRIKRSEGIISRYKAWLKEKNLDVEDIEYKDMLNYIDYLQKQKCKKVLINEYLVNIGHYHNYLGISNPTIGLRLMGVPKTKPILFKEKELDEIYENFQPLEKGTYRETDKLILSLTIYQALDRKALLHLEKGDIDLGKGLIKARSTGLNRQERILKLESHQIIPFHHYIDKIRLNFNNKLFTRSCENEDTLSTHLTFLSKKIKEQSLKLGYKVKHLMHLRQSRYAIWIKKHGIRKAQYMGGFKNVVSLEKYREIDIEDLRLSIKKYHPLNDF